MVNEGYLIKIEGKPFPLEYTVRDSWKSAPNVKERITYLDANGKKHEYEAAHGRTKIEFRIIEHRMREHEHIISFLQKTKEVSIEYLNDRTAAYTRGTFRIEDIQWKHKRTFDYDIWYEEAQVVMEEY